MSPLSFPPSAITRACSVYCYGALLSTVQLSGIYDDSKVFVDKPMKMSPEKVLRDFDLLSDPFSIPVLTTFLEDHFEEEGSDLKAWIPPDFQEMPRRLEQIENVTYRQFALDLNSLWIQLGREVDPEALKHPERHSFVMRKHPFIVPGGRFRESYYWDSWFIVQGLHACDMHQTSKYIIMNLLDDVENFGFVPNGGRIYYLDRSQPPVLSEMVMDYVKYMSINHDGFNDNEVLSFLESSYLTLKKEYAFWMNDENGHTWNFSSSVSSSVFKLNRYYSREESPRPESFAEDYEVRQNQTNDAIYKHIRAGAESGWDFSSRWIRPTREDDGELTYSDLSSIQTSEIIPVELNSIMYRFEKNLIEMANVLLRHTDDETSNISASELKEDIVTFENAMNARKLAMVEILWDDAAAMYKDFNITAQASSEIISASCFVPFWAGLVEEESVDRSYNAFMNSNLLQQGGVLTTTISTSQQQWDSPNAWAPVVLLIIDGLRKLNLSYATETAENIKSLWLNTCFIAFKNTGYMYEKYNAYEIGQGGGGGEYVPQVGFGWSNGVALKLLVEVE